MRNMTYCTMRTISDSVCAIGGRGRSGRLQMKATYGSGFSKLVWTCTVCACPLRLSVGIIWPNKVRHQHGGQAHLCRRHSTFSPQFEGIGPVCPCYIIALFLSLTQPFSPLLFYPKQLLYALQVVTCMCGCSTILILS